MAAPEDNIPDLFFDGSEPEQAPQQPPRPAGAAKPGEDTARAKKHPAPPQKKAQPAAVPKSPQQGSSTAAAPSKVERSTKIAGSGELSLELDYGGPEPKRAEPTGVDEMEFDPMSLRGDAFDDWASPSQSGAAQGKAAAGELALDYGSAPAVAATSLTAADEEEEFDLLGATSSQRPELSFQSHAGAHGAAPRAAAATAPATAQSAAARVAQPQKRAPQPAERSRALSSRPPPAGQDAGLNLDSLLPLSGPAPTADSALSASPQSAGAIPDLALDVVAAPAPAAVQTAAPAIGELDFDAVPQTSGRNSAYPPAVSSSSAYPPAVAPAAASAAASSLDALPGFSGSNDLGGAFDDLEFGAGGRASQLDVAVALPKDQDDGVAWPTGCTPSPETLSIDEEEVVAMSGYGAVPSSVFGAPMYAVRVLSGRKPLEEKARLKHAELAAREAARDERLAELALSKRDALEKEERYATLYATIDRHDENIEQKSRTLQSADTEGAAELREVEAKLLETERTRAVAQTKRDAQAEVVEGLTQQVSRVRGQIQRLGIDERNLDARFQKDELSEAQYYAALAELKGNVETLEQQVAGLLNEKRASEKQLEACDDQVRLATAEYQRFEGTKEGLLIAFEGAMAEHSRGLDDAKKARRNDLANAGRAILELKGHVRVEKSVRRDLLAADQVVRDAAREYELLRQAVASMDAQMFATGKAMWLGAAVSLILVLVLVKFM